VLDRSPPTSAGNELEENTDVPYDRCTWPAAEDEAFGASDRHNQ
jgi:hypothetical protein